MNEIIKEVIVLQVQQRIKTKFAYLQNIYLAKENKLLTYISPAGISSSTHLGNINQNNNKLIYRKIQLKWESAGVENVLKKTKICSNDLEKFDIETTVTIPWNLSENKCSDVHRLRHWKNAGSENKKNKIHLLAV